MFWSQIHDNKADISPTLSSNYFPTLILLRISQCHQTTLFELLSSLLSYHIISLRSWQTEWRGGLLRISVSNRYHWNYQLCSIPRHRCWENDKKNSQTTWAMMLQQNTTAEKCTLVAQLQLQHLKLMMKQLLSSGCLGWVMASVSTDFSLHERGNIFIT